MPNDRKQVCLRGGDTDYISLLERELDEIDRLDVSNWRADDNREVDVLVWQIDGDIPLRELAETTELVSTLLIADAAQLMDAVDAGVKGFLPARAEPSDVSQAVETIANGGAVVPPELLGQLLRHMVDRQRAERVSEALVSDLTARELEVFELAVLGARRDEIAESLYISPDTVRTHLQRVYRKLGVHSQTELMAFGKEVQIE